MSPLLLLALGTLVVVVAIVGLRAHPFLALLVAALIVAALTPEEAIYRANLKLEHREALFPNSAGDLAAISPEEAQLDAANFSVRQAHFSAERRSVSWFVSRVTEGFGSGCGKIAIVIAMASIIGKCLLDSGSARKIVDSLMRLMGLRGTPIAFAASAFTLGIPVFFDTVFYLLMPLARALRRKTGRDYLLYILTIVAGATMAHSLVPPTPGPLTVVLFFDSVSLGEMMIGGFLLGLITVSVGVVYAYWANRRWEVPLRFPEEDSLEDDSASNGLPPLWIAVLPIALPVILIAGKTCADILGWHFGLIRLLGDKNIALILAAAVSLAILARFRKSEKPLAEAVQDALLSGGMIILITAAGSAFGSVLRDTGIADTISERMQGGSSLLLIPTAFVVTAMVRTAQGSATVAMITAGGIIAPIAGSAELGYSALYLALAIGCGSKPISWANDSGFWVIGRMSGMTPVETFRSVSVMMILMAVAGLIAILIAATVLPLA